MPSANDETQLVSDDNLYDEIGLAWRHFASWREKAFAGYLAVLAALALVFTRHPGLQMRMVVFASCILVSIVFWILEDRSRRLINICQVAAARLERGRGCYGDLNHAGKTLLTFGFAVGVLVSGVTAASVGAICIYWIRWRTGDPSAWPAWPLVLAVALFLCIALALRKIANR